MLATLADFKTLMGWTETAHDALASLLIARASATAEGARCAGRALRRQADRVEYPVVRHARAVRLRLALPPIESVSEVVVTYVPASDAEFDAEVAAVGPMVEGEDYFVDATAGNLLRSDAWWPSSSSGGVGRLIRVTYTGGYVDPAEDPVPEGAIPPPEDLQHAVLQQAILLWQTRGAAGLTGGDFGKGGGAMRFRDDAIHPALVDATRGLRRLL